MPRNPSLSLREHLGDLVSVTEGREPEGRAGGFSGSAAGQARGPRVAKAGVPVPGGRAPGASLPAWRDPGSSLTATRFPELVAFDQALQWPCELWGPCGLLTPQRRDSCPCSSAPALSGEEEEPQHFSRTVLHPELCRSALPPSPGHCCCTHILWALGPAPQVGCGPWS